MDNSIFRVVIAGSRNLSYEEYSYDFLYDLVNTIIAKYLPYNNSIVEIISGGAKGADSFGERLAEDSGFSINRFIPDWEHFDEGDPVKVNKQGKKYNPLAGHKRNIKMAEKGDMLIALWDLKSPGTKHMISYMKKLNKPIIVIRI